MRKAEVYMNKVLVGFLIEVKLGENYSFTYSNGYDGGPISVRMPVSSKVFDYDDFPPFFEGLLPEGANLEYLLKTKNINRGDLFSQLLAVGKDTVGAVIVKEVKL